eukprot:scaffold201837_cov20-Prasinocladus_malaysianus.AAC.1
MPKGAVAKDTGDSGGGKPATCCETGLQCFTAQHTAACYPTSGSDLTGRERAWLKPRLNYSDCKLWHIKQGGQGLLCTRTAVITTISAFLKREYMSTTGAKAIVRPHVSPFETAASKNLMASCRP